MSGSHSFFTAGGSANDPPQIYNWKIYALTGCACMGGFQYGYDSGIMGGLLAMTSFQKSFGLDVLDSIARGNQSANIVSMLQAGAFFGCLFAGSDLIGRRLSLILGSAIFIVGSLMQTVSAGHVGLLMAGRFIGGFGVGIASVLAPLYTSENVPAPIRGRLTATYQLFIQVGIMVSFWINYGQQLHYPSVPAQWQIPLAIQMTPGVILISGMLLLKESPRYLARQGKWEEAILNLSWTRNLPSDHPYVQHEVDDMRKQLANEGLLVSGRRQLWKELFTTKSNRHRLFIGCALGGLQQLMGVNAINYYSPQIFTTLGLVGTTNSLFATGIYGVVKVVASIAFALFLADTLGRRKSLIWFGCLQAFCLFYVGAFVKVANPAAQTSVSGAGYFALVCIYLYIASFEMGWGPVAWIYNSEIHTARLRSLSIGLASATNWLFNFAVSRATPVMLLTMGTGGYGTFIFFGSLCVICVIVAVTCVPETKGMTLEQMDAYFGTPQLSDLESVAGGGPLTKVLDEKCDEAKLVP